MDREIKKGLGKSGNLKRNGRQSSENILFKRGKDVTPKFELVQLTPLK